MTCPARTIARTAATAAVLLSLVGCGRESDATTSIPSSLDGVTASTVINAPNAGQLPVATGGDDEVGFDTTTSQLAPTTTEAPAPKPMVFPADAFFGVNSSTLTPEAKVELAALVADLPAGVLEIYVVGFTDFRGSAADNDRLSSDRAKAVADFLTIAVGERDVVVTSAGRGECCTTGTSAEAMANDRRVEITVTVSS